MKEGCSGGVAGIGTKCSLQDSIHRRGGGKFVVQENFEGKVNGRQACG